MIVTDSPAISADMIVGDPPPSLGYQPPPRGEGGMIDSLRAKFAAAQNPSVETEATDATDVSAHQEAKADATKAA